MYSTYQPDRAYAVLHTVSGYNTLCVLTAPHVVYPFPGHQHGVVYTNSMYAMEYLTVH